MEMKTHDVLVVSAFGRGHWLAAELHQQRMKVLLLDVTAKLGVWPAEDSEGPFGVFRLERYSPSFQARLAHDDQIEEIESGFTIWPPEGVMEFKGPLTRFHWMRQGFPREWLEQLGRGETPSDVRRDADLMSVWPLALAHQLAATRYRPAASALQSRRALPLTANFGLRFATRQGLSKNLQWLADQGVECSDRTEILDLSFRGRGEVSGAELSGARSGLVHFDQMIWTLTGAETAFLSEKLAGHLYPGGFTAPSWCWLRYRLTVQSCPEVQRLPLQVVMVDDLESPWTHQNLMIVQKTPSEERLDVWVRLPAIQRFNRDYLAEYGRRILKTFAKRLPTSNPEIQSLPQEASYTSQELGEPRLPLWEAGSHPERGRRKASNLHFESPENRETHGIDEEFDHQSLLRDRLVRWWQIQQQKLQKQQKKESAP
ncbi:MAG: hypothetical protein KF802_00825 [Bdellovibrionaceae bacterium]|nr:hypothetical protein [Pseudobdellovibrionaceae bacterium]MBX3035132.1 hypothetical protein [Pseudobdellovibrionaceae bacterium]